MTEVTTETQTTVKLEPKVEIRPANDSEHKRAGAVSAGQPIPARAAAKGLGRGLEGIFELEQEPVPDADATPEVNVYVIQASKLPKDISFDYNARVPSKSNRAYKSMRETLKENPEKFFELNGGIALANSRFGLDGGHTVTALFDAEKEDNVDLSRVHVLVRDYGELSPEAMERRSAALNRRVTPPLVGERDLEGDWDPIKRSLAQVFHPVFEFRPNSKPNAPFGVDFLVAILNAWNEPRGEKSYATKGKLVRHYTPTKYARVMPKLNEAIKFWARVYKLLLAEKRVMALDCCKVEGKKVPDVTLPTGEKVKGFIPEALIWPTFAAFSTLLDDKGEWTADPVVELDRRRARLIRQLIADYKASGSNPGAYGKSPTSYLNAIVALRGNA